MMTQQDIEDRITALRDIVRNAQAEMENALARDDNGAYWRARDRMNAALQELEELKRILYQ